MTRSRKGVELTKEEKLSISEKTYYELRQKLMNGEVDPRNRLVEDTLSRELGVSRTPIREAIVRLHADGLLDRRSNGYFIRTLDFIEVRDLYEYRIALEFWAINRIIENPDLNYDLSKLEDLKDLWRALEVNQPKPGPDFVLMDEAFHIDLCAASGNAQITAALESVNIRIRPVRIYDYHNNERVNSTIAEHLQILDCILAGNLDQARKLLRRHVGESLEVVEDRALRSLTNLARNKNPANRSLSN